MSAEGENGKQSQVTRQWSTSTRILVIAVCFLLIVVLVVEIQPLLTPLIIAGLLAYTLNLFVRLIVRRSRLSHKWAVNLVYVVFLLAVIAAPGTLIPLTVRLAQTISTELLEVRQEVEAFMTTPIVIYGRTLPLDELWVDFTSMTTNFDAAFVGAMTVLETTSASLLRLLIIVVTTYYLLMDWKGLHRWLVGLVPDAGQADFERLLRETDLIWRAYLQGTLALMLIMGVVFIVVGYAIGLPGALALGLLTGFLSMIPELGPWIAGTLATLVAFILGSNHLPVSNFWFAVIVAAIYVIAMQIKAIWLRPQVMGRFMHMNTGLVFLAIIAAAMLQGILAALVVLPILATIGLLGRYVRARLLNLEPWPAELIPDPGPADQSGQAETEIGDDSSSQQWQSV